MRCTFPAGLPGPMMDQMNKTRETKRQALLRTADFSKFGALAQLFIMDALIKQGVDVPGYQPGDTNISVLTELLDGDELGVIDAINRHAEHVIEAGEVALVEAFNDHALIHGRAWFGVAGEIHGALREGFQPFAYVCPDCDGGECGREATASWDIAGQRFELGSKYEQGWCNECGDVELKREPISTADWEEAIALADAADDHKAMVAMRRLAKRAADLEADLLAGNVEADADDYRVLFGMIAEAVKIARIDLAATAKAMSRAA